MVVVGYEDAMQPGLLTRTEGHPDTGMSSRLYCGAPPPRTRQPPYHCVLYLVQPRLSKPTVLPARRAMASGSASPSTPSYNITSGVLIDGERKEGCNPKHFNDTDLITSVRTHTIMLMTVFYCIFQSHWGGGGGIRSILTSLKRRACYQMQP